MLQSPQEHLHRWLRSLDADAEGLPEEFREPAAPRARVLRDRRLERTASARGGRAIVCSSPSTARKPRARRSSRSSTAGSSGADGLIGRVGDDFREALDRLVVVLEGRDPVIADLAREVRFRYFDEPVISAARDRVYAEMSLRIAALASDPAPGERGDVISSIVHCPRPLATLLTGAMRAAAPRTRALLVEAMARRYYRVRSLRDSSPGA